jgi:hypothetical protein
MKMRLFVFWFGIVLALSARQAAWGGTWYVDGSAESPGDGTSWAEAFRTIQEGIDAADEGDMVFVGVGTYAENIKFSGRNIVLTSTDPSDPSVVEQTVIDGNKAGAVVEFAGSEDETCVLKGFTITNGGEVRRGGGIHGGGSAATIEKNVITGNEASSSGGGVYRCRGTIRENTIRGNSTRTGGGLSFCHGHILDNAIMENVATNQGGGLGDCLGVIRGNTITENCANNGGGLYHCEGEIAENVISENTATGDNGRGGGLFFCGALITGNTISENSASGDGGGLYACNGTVQQNTITGNSCKGSGGALAVCAGTIQNNTIAGNDARWGGGGLFDCDGEVLSNLITGNVATEAGGYGGGLFDCDGVVMNDTIADNRARYGGGFYECTAVIQNCIIWGNQATFSGQQLELSSEPSFCCIQGWSGDNEGNTAGDPQFADEEGPDGDHFTWEDNDYRLTASWGMSPCVDKGTNEDWMRTAVDLDGNNRMYYGHSSMTVDMGAYEYGSFLFRVLKVETVQEGEETRLSLTWGSRAEDSYIVLSRVLMGGGEGDTPWTEEAIVQSEGQTTKWTDPAALSEKKFYCVELE